MNVNLTKMTMSSDVQQNEIWLCIDSFLYGGIETHVMELAKGLMSFGKLVRVILLTRYQKRQPILDKLEQHRIPYQFLEALSKSASSPFVQFRQAIHKYRPLLIHAHGYKASILSRLACIFSPDVAHFTTFHAGETPRGKVRIYDFIDRFTAPLSTHNFAVSSAVSYKVFGKALVLNNFVTVPPLSKRTNHTIAFVGRLSDEKAPDRFLALALQFPQQSFHIYGTGPLLNQLVEQAPSNVVFHGYTENMETIWPSIDILIIPSRFEGLPMAALEGMAMGVPVIATNVGALSHLIRQGDNGWVVDSLPQLSHHINQWIELDTQSQNTIRQCARATISRHFSPEVIVPIILQHYPAMPLNE